METKQLQTPCEGEIKRILDLVVEKIMCDPIHQEAETAHIINTENPIEVEGASIDVNVDFSGNCTTDVSKAEKEEYATQSECMNPDKEENDFSISSQNNSPEEKELFTKALDLVTVCSQVKAIAHTPCLNVSSLKILAAKKSLLNTFKNAGDSISTKEPDTVHFNSPLAVVYEYTQSQSSCSGSTQHLSDEDSDDVDDVKEDLKLDKYPCTENINYVKCTDEDSAWSSDKIIGEELSGDKEMASLDNTKRNMVNHMEEKQECMDQQNSHLVGIKSCTLGVALDNDECVTTEATVNGVEGMHIVTDSKQVDESLTIKSDCSLLENQETLEIQMEKFGVEITPRTDIGDEIDNKKDESHYNNVCELGSGQNVIADENVIPTIDNDFIESTHSNNLDLLDSSIKTGENQITLVSVSSNSVNENRDSQVQDPQNVMNPESLLSNIMDEKNIEANKSSQSDVVEDSLQNTEEAVEVARDEVDKFEPSQNGKIVTFINNQTEMMNKKSPVDSLIKYIDEGVIVPAVEYSCELKLNLTIMQEDSKVTNVDVTIDGLNEGQTNSQLHVPIGEKKTNQENIHTNIDSKDITDHESEENNGNAEIQPDFNKSVIVMTGQNSSLMDNQKDINADKFSADETSDKKKYHSKKTFCDNLMTPAGDSFNTFLTKTTEKMMNPVSKSCDGIPDALNKKEGKMSQESKQSEIKFPKDIELKEDIEKCINKIVSICETDQSKESCDIAECRSFRSDRKCVEQKTGFSPIIVPVKEIFHKAQMNSQFDRSPDLFLETESVNSMDLSDSGNAVIKDSKSAEEEKVINNNSELSEISSHSLFDNKDVSGEHVNVSVEEVMQLEAIITDKNNVFEESQAHEVNCLLNPTVNTQGSLEDENCGENKDTLNDDHNMQSESKVNSRKRKLFHTQQDINHTSAKVIKTYLNTQECTNSMIEQELKQPFELKALATKALDVEEENTIWCKSCPEQVNDSTPCYENFPSNRDVNNKQESDIKINQTSLTSSEISYVETKGEKIEPSNELDFKVSERCLIDLNENQSNEDNKLEPTISDIDMISAKKTENEEYPGFISATEHLSQTSQGSSTGFVVNGQPQEVGNGSNSQTSDKSITFVDDLQTISDEIETSDKDDKKMYFELAKEMDTTDDDLNGEAINADKDIEMDMDTSDIDSYIDKSIDQIVPDEDINQADGMLSETVCTNEGEAKLYACDMDIYDDADKPVCNKIEKSDHGAPKAGCFKWRYAPSCDLENTTQTEPDLDLEDQVVRIMPLKTCGKPIRVGLSRKQSIGHLHKMKVHKPL